MAAASSTYVQIVNATIQESGAESATYDTGGTDFTTRTDKYMVLLKTHVQRAWKEIQMQNYDWEFMSEQGLCNIDPGIMFYTDGTPISSLGTIVNTTVNIYDQDGTVAIPNVVLTGLRDLTGVNTLTKPFGYVNVQATGTSQISFALKPGAEYFTLAAALELPYQFTCNCNQLTSNITVGSGVWCDLIYNGTAYTNAIFLVTATVNSQLTFLFSDPTLYSVLLAATASSNIPHLIVFNTADATKTAVLPSTAEGNVGGAGVNASGYSVSYNATCYVHSWKSYNFSEEISRDDFQENIEEINQKSFRLIDFYHSTPYGEVPLEYMAWESFRSKFDLSSAYCGVPRLISEDDTGRFRFYPAPYYRFSIKFEYIRTPQILTAYNDVPKGINEEFVDMIMWKALMYYGEYIVQADIVARAEQHYKDLLARLAQKSREKPHFKPKQMY